MSWIEIESKWIKNVKINPEVLPLVSMWKCGKPLERVVNHKWCGSRQEALETVPCVSSGSGCILQNKVSLLSPTTTTPNITILYFCVYPFDAKVKWNISNNQISTSEKYNPFPHWPIQEEVHEIRSIMNHESNSLWVTSERKCRFHHVRPKFTVHNLVHSTRIWKETW